MDLWIRSQDKEVLSKVNNLCYYTREDVCEFIKEDELKADIQHIVWSPDGSVLGYYKTKERALEVLDDIQNFIENDGEEYLNEQECFLSRSVYEMPEE